MKPATRDQTHEVIARVIRNTNWGQLNGDSLQRTVIEMSGEEFGRRFTSFLQNGANFNLKGPNVLVIDRTNPFDPAAFIGSGWTIWRGAKDGDGLRGEEEQDARSLAMTEVDFSKVLFTACLKEGESYITGEEKLSRHAAANHVRLDARIVQALLEEKGQVTLDWLYVRFSITGFELPGTVLRGPDGFRYFLCLYRLVDGRCFWYYNRLDNNRSATSVSALGK